ncbi:MAG: FctA domain-containing protein [Coriobacteriales bacterium]|nr:FctA domain-containing protein [Coriobacteriales bacterium]
MASIVLVLSLVPVQGLAEALDEAADVAATATPEEQPGEGGEAATNNDASGGTGGETGAPAQNPPANEDEQGNQQPQPAAPESKPEQPEQPKNEPAPEQEPPAEQPDRNLSANLADFITKAEIEGADEKDGATVVDEGVSYNVKLTFTEGIDGKEYAETEELTYALPSGFTADGNQPASADPLVVTYVDDNGARQAIELDKNSWWVDNNTIHLVWRVRDANTRSKEEVEQALKTLYAFTEMEFDLNVAGTFNKDAKEVDFGTGAIALSVASAKKDEDKEEKKDDEEKKDEEEDEVEEEAEEEEAERTQYVFENDELRVVATTTNASVLPDTAELVVTRVQQGDAFIQALNDTASNTNEYDANNTLLYDVAFVQDGVEVQPKDGDVSVSFQFKGGQLSDELDADAKGYVEVNHLPVIAGVPMVEQVDANVSVAKETANFTATSFSVYSFSYTVDFSYGGYFYQMPGRGSVMLSSLFMALGINRSAADATKVTFSDPELLSVLKIDNNWRLTSQSPFNTPETLIVVMNNGDVITIDVTDAQDGATGTIKVTCKNEGIKQLSAEDAKKISIIVTGADDKAWVRTLDKFDGFGTEGADLTWTISDVPEGKYTVSESGTESETWNITTTYKVGYKRTQDVEVKEKETSEITVTNTFAGKAALKVAKKVDGEGYEGTEDFSFKLAKTGEEKKTIDINLPTELTGLIKSSEDEGALDTSAEGTPTISLPIGGTQGETMPKNTTATAKNGEVATFDAITYSKPGTYTYTITETEPSLKTNGMTYDTLAKYAKVVVDDNLQTTVTYGVTEENIDDKELVVTNVYADKPGTITVRKVVSSSRAEDKKKSYTFKVTLTGMDGKKVSGTYGDMEFKDGEATFTLKHNEKKVAKGIPLNDTGNLIYNVVETDSCGLTSKMSESKSKDGNSTTITCTNTYRKPASRLSSTRASSSSARSSSARGTLSKTGDSTNMVLPIVVLVAGVAIVAGGIWYRRRKQQ